MVPSDFICPVETHNPIRDGVHHRILFSNFVAQTEALMRGKSLDVVKEELKKSGASDEKISQLAPQKVCANAHPQQSWPISSKC